MKKRDFGLETMSLTRKCVLLELSGVRRDYKNGCFDNAMAKCDSIIREAKRLKKVIAIEKRERFKKGRNIRVNLNTTIVSDLIVRVPNGADAQKFISNYIRRKNIHAANNGIYTNESASIQDGEETRVFYPYAR